MTLSEKKHQPIKITPHLYQLGVKEFPAYLSMGELGMLIEGGTSATTDIIVRQIEMLGIDPSKISCLVLPHTHADHVGAVPRIRELWPHMKIIAGEVGAKFLAKDSFIKGVLPADKHITDLLTERYGISKPPSQLDTYNFRADEVVSEGDKIELGDGVVWEVYTAPGHSLDHISLIEKKESTLVVGDIAGYYEPDLDIFWPNYFAGLEAYCNSIRKLAVLPANRALLGHNGIINNHVREHFKKALKATEVFHNELLSRSDSGEDKKEIAKEKAYWVYEFAPLAPLEGISFLNGLMVKTSLEERAKELFFFPE